MCDLHSKFEEDRTKTAVVIVDDKYFRQTGGHTDIQTDRHTLMWFLYLSNAMRCIGQTKQRSTGMRLSASRSSRRTVTGRSQCRWDPRHCGDDAYKVFTWELEHVGPTCGTVAMSCDWLSSVFHLRGLLSLTQCHCVTCWCRRIILSLFDAEIKADISNNCLCQPKFPAIWIIHAFRRVLRGGTMSGLEKYF